MAEAVRSRVLRSILLPLVIASLCASAHGRIIYVDARATGANTGTSWPDAHVYLQDALADASAVEEPVEIRVAQGIYRPDRSAASPDGTGNRDASFELVSDLTLAGGYAGAGASDPNVRDWEAYVTILSGDLNGDDVDPIDARRLAEDPNRAENSYHVVAAGATEQATLDGFTITSGNADGVEEYDRHVGGGVYSDSGSPLIRYCTLTKNSCRRYGAGMYIGGPCHAVIEGCDIIGNGSQDDGGGLFLSGDFGAECAPVIMNCIIRDNWAGDGSGGIRCDDYTSPTIGNCIVAGNASGDEGGGVSCKWGARPRIENCTIVGNSSRYGGGVYCIETDTVIADCLIGENKAAHGDEIALALLQEEQRQGTTVTIAHSDVRGGQDNVYVDHGCVLVWSGTNMSVDPCFASPGYWDADVWIEGDYHLKSGTGRWDPDSQSWVLDDVTSPCIDAGDPNSYIRYEPRSISAIRRKCAFQSSVLAPTAFKCSAV